MERKRGWLEKELEMLHTMIQQQPNMPTLDIHNETEDSPSLGPSTSTSEATQAPEVPKVSPASLPKFSPASPPPSPSPPHKTGEVCNTCLWSLAVIYFLVVFRHRSHAPTGGWLVGTEIVRFVSLASFNREQVASYIYIKAQLKDLQSFIRGEGRVKEICQS